MKQTGFKDKYGRDICVGDMVKFRSSKFRVSGRGIVIEHDKWGFAIKDTRTEYECKRRNVGSIHSFNEDIDYVIISELKGENNG